MPKIPQDNWNAQELVLGPQISKPIRNINCEKDDMMKDNLLNIINCSDKTVPLILSNDVISKYTKLIESAQRKNKKLGCNLNLIEKSNKKLAQELQGILIEKYPNKSYSDKPITISQATNLNESKNFCFLDKKSKPSWCIIWIINKLINN